MKVAIKVASDTSVSAAFISVEVKAVSYTHLDVYKRQEVLRKAHPEIKIVGSSGPQSEGKDFDYLWPEMKNQSLYLQTEDVYKRQSIYRPRSCEAVLHPS